MSDPKKLVTDPLIENNPVILQTLGICSALAVTSSLEVSLIMCLALTSVVAFSNLSISLIRYQDFMFGVNFEPLIGVFYDISGVAPGIGQNFSEGNVTGLFGLRFDYLSKWFTELRYTYVDGEDNARRDRDTLAFTLRYEF